MTALRRRLVVWLVAATTLPFLPLAPAQADAPPEAVELPAVPASVDPRGRGSKGPLATGTVSMDARTKARMQGYEGDPCGECGNDTLVRNGTCMKCNTCGGTSGCS